VEAVAVVPAVKAAHAALTLLQTTLPAGDDRSDETARARLFCRLWGDRVRARRHSEDR
jgi:hypothetical protein